MEYSGDHPLLTKLRYLTFNIQDSFEEAQCFEEAQMVSRIDLELNYI